MELTILEISAILFAALSGVLSLSATLLAKKRLSEYDEAKNSLENKHLAVRIKNISATLNTAASEMNDIQKLLEERIALVEKLSEQAKNAESIASINKEQVDAIDDMFSERLKSVNRKNFRQSIFVNAVFFVLGIVVTLIFSMFIR